MAVPNNLAFRNDLGAVKKRGDRDAIKNKR